jgi:preprotein translocase subunit SecG
MSILFASLIIISCVLLVIIILVQNPKGGGLSSSFGGGGTQLFGGVKKTTDFLDRGTWVLAIVLVALVLGMNVMVSPRSAAGTVDEQSEISKELNENPILAPQGGQNQLVPADELPEEVGE